MPNYDLHGLSIHLTPNRQELELLFQTRGVLPPKYHVTGMVSQEVVLQLSPDEKEPANDQQ